MKEIMEILYQYDIDISEVADYHRYPVAEWSISNDS